MSTVKLCHDIPIGINVETRGRGAFTVDSISTPFGRVSGRTDAPRVFEVQHPTHTQSKNGGVVFTIETVPPAIPADTKMDCVTREAALKAAALEASKFYNTKTNRHIPKKPRTTTPQLEAMSDTPQSLVFTGGHGFLAACMTAFARHLPLSLDATDIWTVISFAFAKHVDKHSEELRKNFVSHEGKKELLVIVDHFVMSRGGDPDTGTPAEAWEKDVFPDFSKQIKTHIGEATHSLLAGEFSTSTSATQAASEIALMSTMKHYFSYKMRTRCGIPRIELRGTLDDWKALRSRAEEMGKLMTPEFSKKWMSVLLPILDEFIKSYNGDVNYGFWQSMVKFRHTGGGSGAHSFVSGWIQNLFPYLTSSDNYHLCPWQDAYFRGPEPDDFPSVMCSAPVVWDYYGKNYKLHFHAGFSGFCQDGSDGTLSPSVGWKVTHDPRDEGVSPEETTEEVRKVKKNGSFSRRFFKFFSKQR